MRIQINDKWSVLPSSLSEITLQQRIDFQKQHGDLLIEMEKSISEIEDEDERELEMMQLKMEQMYRAVSFFTNCTVEAIKESEYIDVIANLYISSLQQVFEDENRIAENVQNEFTWNNDIWHLHSPELKNGDRMTFGEFIDSKQIIQDMIGLGKNKWECLLPLCAIYLRKEDEIYEESFLYENSDRLNLMKSLPLDIALQVGFFLSSSLSMFLNIFQSSGHQGLKALANTSRNTSSNLVGSTS